ncbi:PepSY domain-containing protein [Niveispirillum fermenti]|uniref:PepSY domain-containing protein n=1 Tax=Niveispirillum fermenti TaxID=1233113 RepID=UPI003A86D8C6
MRRLFLLLPLCLALAAAGTVHVRAVGDEPAWTDEGDDDDDDDIDDHDLARAALERGEIMSLRDIMEMAERGYPGRLLEVELEIKRGRFVYDIELLSPDGRLIELLYDARTGELLRVKGAGRKDGRPAGGG